MWLCLQSVHRTEGPLGGRPGAQLRQPTPRSMPTPRVEGQSEVCAPSCSPPVGRRGLRWGAQSGGRTSRGRQDREGVRPLFSMRKGWSASPGTAGWGGCCPASCRSVSPSSWGGCRESRLSGFANGYGVNTPCEADFLLQPAGRECGVRTCEQAPAHPGRARLLSSAQ